MTRISPFFAIYRYYLNILFMVRDDRSEEEISIAREVIEKIKSEDIALAE